MSYTVFFTQKPILKDYNNPIILLVSMTKSNSIKASFYFLTVSTLFAHINVCYIHIWLPDIFWREQQQVKKVEGSRNVYSFCPFPCPSKRLNLVYEIGKPPFDLEVMVSSSTNHVGRLNIFQHNIPLMKKLSTPF